jgi:glycosyltransferase involved in cell wall biosynthesis
MKILLFNNLYPPYVLGGNEILASEVVQALRRRGHDVHVGTGRSVLLQARAQVHGCLNLNLDRLGRRFLGQGKPNVFEKAAWQIFDPITFALSARLIARVKPDLVVAWNLSRVSAAPLLAARLAGTPMVAHVADKWLLSCLYDLGGWWPPLSWGGDVVHTLKRRLLQSPMRRLCGHFPVIAISDFIRQYYAKTGIPAGLLYAERLGVDTDQFTPPARARRSRTVHALYVGSLWAGKGPQIAVRALGELVWKRGVEHARLDIYGDGTADFRNFLQQLIAHERLQDHVTLHGYGGRREVIAAMQTHDFLVFPSLWDEPFAAVPVEAMSCGLPVLASDAGGTPEIVRHEHNGLLVRAGDATALAEGWFRLAAEPGMRRRMGENARETAVSGYTFDGYISRIEALYHRLARR